jgi:cell division protein FtsL
MKYEKEIFRILCVLSLTMILSIIFINKCNAQTFIDTVEKNEYIITDNKIKK